VTAPFGHAAAAAAADAVRQRTGSDVPDVGLILGSGLGGLTAEIESPIAVRYDEIPGFPLVSVAGHAGTLVAGRLRGKRVVALSGRVHIYDGLGADAAGFAARLLHAMGVRMLAVTNAAGGIRRTWRPGTIMLIRDHINFLFGNPLIGRVEPGDARFPDMSDPYDAALRRLSIDVALRQRIAMEEGVYAAVHGPSYETPAEVRMLAFLGADAVGMSTVPEVLVARALGLRVVGWSVITNLASGLTPEPMAHADVIATAERAGDALAAIVGGLVERV